MKAWREVIGTLLILGLFTLPAPGAAENVKAGTDNRLGHSDANLDRNPASAPVHAERSHGTLTLTLTGTVDHSQNKKDFARNTITVVTEPAEDVQLQRQLEDRLHCARAGLAMQFPGVRVNVHDGIVTLSGTVSDSIEHALALALAGTASGVLSIRDEINVLPDGLNDDAVTIQVNNATYGPVHLQLLS